MDYRDLTLKDIEMQEKLLGRFRDAIREYPSGGLVCRNYGNKKEYYHVDKLTGKRKYIKKDNYNLLSSITQRRIFEESVARMSKNIIAQEKMLREYRPYDYGSVRTSLPAAYQGWQPKEKPMALKGSILRPEGLVHTTSCGQKVRSKTELMIVETMLSCGLPLIYEKALTLLDINGNPITIHPDFAFKTRYRGWIYWEHFGMLGNEDYRQDALWKIELYIANGIMPAANLIITSESSDGALDVNTIINTVEYIKKLL